MRCRFPTEKLIITDSWTIGDLFFFLCGLCFVFNNEALDTMNKPFRGH